MVNAVKKVRVGAKAKKAVEIVCEKVRKGGRIVQKDVLLEAGYSESKADSPGRVFNAKPFREILEQYAPKESLAKAHKNLLEYKKMTALDFPLDMEDEVIEAIIAGSGAELVKIVQFVSMKRIAKVAYITSISPDVVLRALDLAYKVGGDYAPTETKNTTIDLVALFNAAMAARRSNQS